MGRGNEALSAPSASGSAEVYPASDVAVDEAEYPAESRRSAGRRGSRWRRTPAARPTASWRSPSGYRRWRSAAPAIPAFVDQPRVLDRDRGLIGKTLLKQHLLVGEGREPVAVDDQRADRLAFTPQGRAGHRTGAGRARRREARPAGDGGIDIVEIGTWTCRFSATMVPGMLLPPIRSCASGTRLRRRAWSCRRRG